MFAQLHTEPEDPNGNLTAVGVDFYGFTNNSFYDFNDMAITFEAWAERFSEEARWGYILQKKINGIWSEIGNNIIYDLKQGANGLRWVNSWSAKYIGDVAAPTGNGQFRSKGWVDAWYLYVYDESTWDLTTVNDVIAPQTPTTFTGYWTNGHPTLTIDGNSEYDFEMDNIYKKVDNGAWNYLASITGNTYIDNSETKYTIESKIKRNVYYKAKAVDFTANESAETSSIKFVCNDQINKNNLNDKNETDIISEFSLEQNYPNPFNPTTEISFSIGKISFVDLSIYNMLGQKVKTLLRETKDVGQYELTFDASGLSAGTYIYKLTTNDFTSTKKMILMK